MTRNILRKAAVLGILLNPPAFFPFNPLLALRTSLIPLESAARVALINALFEAVWVRSLHVSESAVVEKIVNDLGLPSVVAVSQAQSPEIKSLLRLEHKAAHFELDRATIENSLRSIFARFANPEVAKRTLDSVRAALPGDARLPFTEPLLLAPSQPDGRARFWRCAARVSAQRPM